VIRLLVFLFAARLCAQTTQPPSKIELWNWYFWEAFDNGKFRVRGVAQFRSQPHRGEFLRSQGGPILEWQASRRWNLIAGYYFQESRQAGSDVEFQGAHRPFGGFEYAHPIGKYGFETRHLYEYFKSLSGRDSARGRARVRFEFPLRMSPFAQNEVFYDRLGIQANRSEAGIQYKVAKPFIVQFSIFHELRPVRTGGSRTVFSTRFNFNGPWFHPK